MNTTALATAQRPGKGLSRGAQKRLVAAAAFGSVIEQYDFFCYAFIAPLVFEQAFFPKLHSLTGTLAVYATFAVGFISRPLGGVVFGHYGDRIGRKVTLLVTLLIMGIASVLIGCLPTYATVGLWAPAMLVILRFIQGFAFGGEYLNAVTLALEGAPSRRRGLFASFINAAGPVGVVAASGIVALLSGAFGPQEFASWVWRIPFLLSIVMVALGVYMRYQVDESAIFQELKSRQQTAKLPIVDVLVSWKLPVLRSLLVNMTQSTILYIAAVFVLGYAVKRLDMPTTSIIGGVSIANVFAMLTIPFFGMISDRWGRESVLLLGVALVAAWFPVFIYVISLKVVTLLVVAMIITIGLMHPIIFAPEAAYTAEQFPTEVRVSGGSLGKQLGIVLGGGFAPFIAASLTGTSGGLTSVTYYVEAVAIVTFIVVLFSPETSHQKL